MSPSFRRSTAGTPPERNIRVGGIADEYLRIEEIAKKKGVSMAQIACAWVLSKPHVTAPIIGTTSLKNLEDILGE